MGSKFLEVDPNLVWQKGKKSEHVKMLTGGDLIKPWSDLRDLPGFSYKTSYQVSFPHHYQFQKFYEPPAMIDIQKKEEGHKYQVFKSQYSTTTGTTYIQKHVKPETAEIPSFLEYLNTLKEKFQTKQFMIPIRSTEYNASYKMPPYDPNLSGEFKDQTSDTYIDKVPKLAKEMQPNFETSQGGVRREKDIYKSQTHLTHHHFPPDVVRKAREPLIGQTRLRIYSDPHPLDPHLRIPFRQVNLLKKTNPVPHRGMLTESQEKYIPQVDFFAPNDTVKEVERFAMKADPTDDMITAVDKYHTDYSHIGHNWNTQTM